MEAGTKKSDWDTDAAVRERLRHMRLFSSGYASNSDEDLNNEGPEHDTDRSGRSGNMTDNRGGIPMQKINDDNYWMIDKAHEKFKTLQEIMQVKDNGDFAEQTTDNNVQIYDYPNFPEIPEDLPCTIYYMNDKTATLKPFSTFGELSNYFMQVAQDGNGKTDKEELLNTVLKFPLKRMVHYVSMAAYLRHLYENDKVMDVIVDVAGQKFRAHSLALCCFSDFFSNLFKANVGRSLPIKIRVNGVCPSAFAAFLEFCYTGQLTVTSETALELLMMADLLKVEKLVAMRNTIIPKVPIGSLVLWLASGKTGVMFEPIIERFIECFSEAKKVEDILELGVEVLCKALGSDQLDVQNEFQVFQTAFRWLVHDPDTRLQYTLKLMNLVRFCYMTCEELYDIAETTRLLKDYDRLRQLIVIGNWQAIGIKMDRSDPLQLQRPVPRRCYSDRFSHIKEINQQPDVQRVEATQISLPPPLMTSTPISMASPRYAKPLIAPPELRSPSMSPQLAQLPDDEDRYVPTQPKMNTMSTVPNQKPDTVDILVVGGFVTSDTSENPKYVERYDVQDDQWVHFCKIPQPRRFHAIVTLYGYMYMIGGSDPEKERPAPVATQTVYAMDVADKSWSQCSDMAEARIGHSVCAVNDRIYVFGGKDEENCVLSSVECYNPGFNTWHHVRPMNVARFAASAASLHGNIFVVGGIAESVTIQLLTSVECYDPDSDCWTMLRDLRVPRCNASLVSINNNLYLCGGATKTYSASGSSLLSLADIDLYDDVSDSWHVLTTMVIPRHDAGVAVVGDRLYIIGGISTSLDRVLQSVECYDTTTRCWLPAVQDLPMPARWICCASLVTRWRAEGQVPVLYTK